MAAEQGPKFCLLHAIRFTRLVSRKFATVYLPLPPLLHDKFMKGHCLLSFNRKGANGVTVRGQHTEFQLRCDQAWIAGFLDNIWGLVLRVYF